MENSVNSKNEPEKRKRRVKKGPQEKRADSKVSDEERNQEAKKSKTKQCVNSTIEPIIQHQVGHPLISFLYSNPHHYVLQLPLQPNVIDKKTLLSHFKTTRPFTAAHSMPLYTTPGLGPSTPDLMVRALHTKAAYQHDLTYLEKRYKRSTPLRIDSDGSENVQSTVALVYAALLDRDPNPYLQLSMGYDYHYTGGTLAAVRTTSSNGSDGFIATIFKAIGASLENVEVLRIGVSAQDDFHCSGDLKVRETEFCPIDMIGPILEIIPNDDGTVVLIRKQNVIIILRQVDVSRGEKKWQTVQLMFSTDSFASICFVTGPPAPCETLTLCTTDYQQQLQLWIVSDAETSCEDIVKLPPVTSTSGKTLTDNWSTVRSVDDRSLVACLDRRTIRFYAVVKKESPNADPEADTYQLVYRGGNDFSNWTIKCEQCCALETTPSEGLLFIATCHKLLVGKIESSKLHSKDTQPLEENGQSNISYAAGDGSMEFKVLLVFAHNLQQRPVFISHQWEVSDAKGSEHHFVLFGSHLPMSYGIASFNRSGRDTSVYAAQHYPYQPPTFHDTYRLAQTRGFCLSAYQPLQKRFYACQSGAVLIRGTARDGGVKEPRLHILLQTSAGDLLQQRLSYSLERAEEKVDRVSVEKQKQTMALVLQHWHDMLVTKVGKLPYSATSFRTMQKFRDIFNCPTDGNDLKEILLLPPKPKRIRKKKNGYRQEEETQIESEDGEELQSSNRHGASTPKDKTQRQQKHGNKPPVIPWRQTIEELQQYRDVLASSMLAVWGIGGKSVAPGQNTNAVSMSTPLAPLADITERVGSWVNDTVSERHELEDIAGENETMDDLYIAPNQTAMETAYEACNSSKELYTPLSWPPSQTLTASQLPQHVEQPERAIAKSSKRVYSKGF